MVGVGIGFKGRNIRAQKWAEKFAARRVVEINEGTRAGLAALIRRSIREGISPYDTGRLIRPMIGLTERSAMAVMNYRKGLMDAGGSMAVVDRAVERYAAKKLRERAMTIARNEAMLALNTSAAQEAKEAVRDGRLGKYMVKVWLVTPDERLCFGKGMPVSTPAGDVPIEEIAVGDSVLTPSGPRRVIATKARAYSGLMVRVPGGIATADHPYLVLRDGELEWCPALFVSGDDRICVESRRHDGDSVAVDVVFKKVRDVPPVLSEPSVTPLVFGRVSMPVGSIGFENEAAAGEEEVNGFSAHRRFLNERLSKLDESEPHGLLDARLALEFSVARDVAKAGGLHFAGAPSERPTTVGADDDGCGASALFRTMFPVGMSDPEYASARSALGVERSRFSASSRAVGAGSSGGVGGRDREDATACGTDLADGGGSLLRVAGAGAESLGLRDIESLTADFAGLIGPNFGGDVVAGGGAELLLKVRERLVAGGAFSQFHAEVTVYSIQVDQASVFFAGGALVHNCPICAPLEGTTTPADESFPDGDPPIHVICRCTFGLQPGETQFGEVTRTAPMPIDGMERVGNATGANAGGIYKDLTGQRWYVKKAGRGGEEYARNEVLANRLYRETGLNVPDVRLATLDGDIGVASKIVELSSEKVTAARLIAYKEARGGFAVDVLLGNFDVVGTGYSNMAITKAGRILRVDAGGSLAFWGEGTRKGALWGASVEREMAIMQIKDAIGFEAGSVFGGMTRAEVIASMKRVEDLSESAIRRLVAEFGPLDEKAATAMIDTLLARRADILSRRVVLKLEEKASSP